MYLRQKPTHLSIPLLWISSREQLPIDLFHGEIGFCCVLCHRSCYPIRLIILSTSRNRDDMIDCREEFPKGEMTLICFAILVIGKGFRHPDRQYSQCPREDQTKSRVTVDEPVTTKNLESF